MLTLKYPLIHIQIKNIIHYQTFLGGKVCISLDLSEAYLQLPVSENAKHLLTINTRVGLFQYQRLPFGGKNRTNSILGRNGQITRKYLGGDMLP